MELNKLSQTYGPGIMRSMVCRIKLFNIDQFISICDYVFGDSVYGEYKTVNKIPFEQY